MQTVPPADNISNDRLKIDQRESAPPPGHISTDIETRPTEETLRPGLPHHKLVAADKFESALLNSKSNNRERNNHVQSPEGK